MPPAALRSALRWLPGSPAGRTQPFPMAATDMLELRPFGLPPAPLERVSQRKWGGEVPRMIPLGARLYRVKEIEQKDDRERNPNQPQQKSASHVDLPKTEAIR